MIVDIIQTKNSYMAADMWAEWVAIHNGDMIARGVIPCGRNIVGQDGFNGNTGILIWIFGEGYDQELQVSPYRPAESFRERFTWRFYENRELIGTIKQKTQKVKGFLQNYVYTEFQYKYKTYKCYEVGLGRKGIYVCIYRDNELVDVIDKAMKTVNYLDKYTCYLLYEEDSRAVIAYAMYYDKLKYSHEDEEVTHSVRWHALNTISKELLAKYDPSFIDRVKELRGLKNG